jgi:hypothetical protein
MTALIYQENKRSSISITINSRTNPSPFTIHHSLFTMKNVPHWQPFVIFYLVIVAVPVYFVHIFLKKRAYANRTFGNLLLYFAGVIGLAFVMHSLCMWLYFSFFFQR